MSTHGQGTKCRGNIAENHNHLVHERYTQTDERAREFTFAKNQSPWVIVPCCLRDPTFSRFGRTVCDGQIVRHGHSIYRAVKKYVNSTARVWQPHS